MAREGGLGKGLSSLIPQKKSFTQNSTKTKKKEQEDQKEQKIVSNDFEDEVYKKKSANNSSEIEKNQQEDNRDFVLEIETDQIKANPFQPRQSFNEEKLNELASSIKKHGIIQPLVVSERPEGGYELIAGERRFKASQKNGLKKVPAIVKKIGEKEKIEWALIENIQRDDLNAIEEAEAYQRLMNKFSYNQEEIALQVGKSRSTIANTLRLLELSSRLKKMVKENKISEGHARALLGLESENEREFLADEIFNKKLSVRETEKRVQKINQPNSERRLKAQKDPNVVELESKVSEVLGTKVNIKKSKKGGQFILQYYSDEEFNSLFNKLIS